MRANWGAVIALTCSVLLGGLTGANAQDSGPELVAQAADCELARDIWGDLKGTSSQAAINAYITQFSGCPVYAALAEERLGELGGPVSAPASVRPIAAAPVPETECDRQAGYTFHPRLPGLKGVETDAITACTEAVRAYPQESFFSLLLARAYQKADASDPRIETLVRAGMEGHRAFGLSRLGLLYAYGGAGLTADPVQAADHARQSCDLGDTTGCNDLGTEMMRTTCRWYTTTWTGRVASGALTYAT